MSDVELIASDPSTSEETLAQLVQTNPEVQHLVAANPTTYPELVEWLALYGTPEAKQVAGDRLTAAGPIAPEAATAEHAESPTAEPDVNPPSPVTSTAQDETVVFTAASAEGLFEDEPAAPTQTGQSAPTQTGQSAYPQATQPVYAPVQATQPAYAPALQQTQPTNGNPQSVEPSKRGFPWAAVLGALAGVVLAVAIGFAVWFFALRDDGEATKDAQEAATAAVAQSETQQAEQDAAEAEAEAAELEEERAELEKLKEESEEQQATQNSNSYPAPSNAVSAPWFLTPSKNIACKLDNTGAWCTIYEASFDLSAGGCTSTPYTVHAGADGTEWDCSVSPVPNDSDGPILEYSTSSTSANAACTSTSRGVTCWDTTTGSSFALARQGFMFGSNGVIPETEFPWR